jgi:hypothetical protein
LIGSAKGLLGRAVHATDGEVGSVSDLFFDDALWQGRYVVVKAGSFFSSREVPVLPEFVEEAGERVLRAGLTRRQVEDAPPVEADLPVADRQEVAYYGHYGAAPYWGAGLQTSDPVSGTGYMGAYAPQPGMEAGGREGRGDPHLRSVAEVTGYGIEAIDGGIGHVEDLLVELDGWQVRYLVVDTRNWLPGKKVLVSPEWIRGIDWVEGEVRVDLLTGEIKNSPRWDPNTLPDPDYEVRLHEHYVRAPRRTRTDGRARR